MSVVLISATVAALFAGARHAHQKDYRAWLLHGRIEHFLRTDLTRGSWEGDRFEPIPLDDASLMPLLVENAKLDPAGAYAEMSLAIEKGRPDIARTLLKGGADAKVDWDAPLATAISKGYGLLALELIQAGADVRKAEDSRGFTPLHAFMIRPRESDDERSGHWRQWQDIPELLLARGADPNAKDASDATPLHLLCDARDGQELFAVAKLLIQHGADVNAKNGDGSTALHLLAERNTLDSDERLKMAGLLIEHGAEVNSRNAAGATPLMLTNDDRLRELLQAKGARP